MRHFFAKKDVQVAVSMNEDLTKENWTQSDSIEGDPEQLKRSDSRKALSPLALSQQNSKRRKANAPRPANEDSAPTKQSNGQANAPTQIAVPSPSQANAKTISLTSLRQDQIAQAEEGVFLTCNE